jgi:hypothetical protein
VSEKAVKISIAVNRFRVTDPKAVWELGQLSWPQIIRTKNFSLNYSQ